MDAFYAAVEQRDDPTLRGRPVIVGGPSARSVVCTASYEARPFGVRSAMPMIHARERCPQAVVVPPRMSHYAGVSRQVFEVFARFTPVCEPLSLDEAFLDVSQSQALFGDGPTIASAIRRDIQRELSLTASAGVATSKFVAKIASDLQKPDGLTVVEPGTEAAFLAPLPVERMWGVGSQAAERLRRAGKRLIGDLASSSPEAVARLLGSSWGGQIVELARGIDPRPVIPDREAVSIGAELTFEEDLTERVELDREILAQSVRVATRLVAAGLSARVVVLKVKLGDHTLFTRRRTLDQPVSDTLSIHQAACALLDRFDLAGRGVRLTGVAVSGLSQDGTGQGSLFVDEPMQKRRALERTLLDVRTRFGQASLTPASLAARAGRRRRRS